jgi:hypothetical protein
MPPKRQRTEADRQATLTRQADSRARNAPPVDPIAAAAELDSFRDSQAREANRISQSQSRARAAESADAAAPDLAVAAAEFQASQAREAHRVSQAQSRSQLQAAAAAASPDPAAAANAVAEFHASQARAANRMSQSRSRARQAQPRREQRRAARAALDADLNALLDVNVYEDDDLSLIESHFERHVAAALAMFYCNTTVAFGYRSEVNMDAQVRPLTSPPPPPPQ